MFSRLGVSVWCFFWNALRCLELGFGDDVWDDESGGKGVVQLGLHLGVARAQGCVICESQGGKLQFIPMF